MAKKYRSSERAIDLVRKTVKTIEENRSLREALEEMKTYDVACLVVTAGADPVGIVTDRSILLEGVATGRSLDETMVGEILTSEPVYCPYEASLEEATQIMFGQNANHLIIVDNAGNLLGLISREDLLLQGKDLSVAA